jgi:hypothetical protein
MRDASDLQGGNVNDCWGWAVGGTEPTVSAGHYDSYTLARPIGPADNVCAAGSMTKAEGNGWNNRVWDDQPCCWNCDCTGARWKVLADGETYCGFSAWSAAGSTDKDGDFAMASYMLQWHADNLKAGQGGPGDGWSYTEIQTGLTFAADVAGKFLEVHLTETGADLVLDGATIHSIASAPADSQYRFGCATSGNGGGFTDLAYKLGRFDAPPVEDAAGCQRACEQRAECNVATWYGDVPVELTQRPIRACAASSEGGAAPCGKAWDGDLSTEWATAPGLLSWIEQSTAVGAWIQLELGTAQHVSLLKYANGEHNIKTLRVDASDGSGTEVTLPAAGSTLTEFALAFERATRHVRLTVVRVHAGGTPPTPLAASYGAKEIECESLPPSLDLRLQSRQRDWRRRSRDSHSISCHSVGPGPGAAPRHRRVRPMRHAPKRFGAPSV